MPLGHPAPTTTLTPTPANPVIAVVSANGDLDDAAAARLLHWCEARLHLLDTERTGVNQLVVDMSHTHHATTSAIAILDQARAEAHRRHVGIHLVAAGSIMATCALPARQRLGRWSTFPTLDAARTALDATAAETHRRPVDPDAIVLTPFTPHDRLG